MAGQCDEHQRMCFALAVWNEHDPILKERLFGLTNNEGNHGEDVKEYYFFLDNRRPTATSAGSTSTRTRRTPTRTSSPSTAPGPVRSPSTS